MKNTQTRMVGVFFTIGRRKFTTMVDYRSKKRFIKLIEHFSKNAKIYVPQPKDKFTFVDIQSILETAYDKLDTKATTAKLVYTLMAQNNVEYEHDKQYVQNVNIPSQSQQLNV